jgi:Uma2 family endonuclease
MASSSYDYAQDDPEQRRGVVVMEDQRLDTAEYLNTYETNRPRELAYGRLREPPAPFYSHQVIVLRIARLLGDHVESRRLGEVSVAPVDVILDAARDLIVQPDVFFIAANRLALVRNQVWGAPDLAVEVLSRSTAAHDRGEKLEWYRQYGVRECWLVDPDVNEITIVDMTGVDPVRRVIRDSEHIESSVLPELRASAAAIFS